MRTSLLSALIVAGSLAGFAFAEEADIIVTVNGKAITSETLGMYSQKRIGAPADGNFPEEKRKELLEELVNRELIYQDAVKNGLNNDSYVQAEIQEQTLNTLTRFQIDKLLEKNPPSASMLQEIYQTQIVAPASKEYRARHILLNDQDAANAIILELNKGANFEKLANEKSVGPSSSDGGDIGWFAPNQMVKPFADAVERLKPGEYTKRPVQTRFGWHIIRLEESRSVQPPSFKSVEAQVLQVAQNRVINDYLQGLKQKAEIKFK